MGGEVVAFAVGRDVHLRREEKKEEKPKKKTWDEELEEFAKKYGLPKENVKYIASTYLNPSIGFLKILAKASPDGSYKRVAKALSAEKQPRGYMYIRGIKEHPYHKKNREVKNPKAVHLPLLHGFLTLALVHHMGSSSPTIGDAIGDALYEWTDIGRGWEELKKNPEEFAEFVLNYLEQTGNAPMNRDATKKVIVQAVKKSAKVLDKMIPTVESLRHLRATSKAVAGDADDPFQILRNAGIDIEPELEEFRQFLAEISGKRVEPKPSETKKVISEELPPEVLSIAKALEFSDFSEKAMKKAEKELLKMIDRFIEEEDAEALLHAVKLLRLVQKGEAEGIKRFGG